MASVERMFMVAIDPFAEGYDVPGLVRLFGNDNLFKDWWHHIPGCFLVTSPGSAAQVSERIATVSGKARLLVFEVNPQQSEGHLASRSWEWIQRREAAFATEDTP